MNKLYVVAHFKLKPNSMDDFKQIAADIFAAVKAKEPDHQMYEWYANADQTEVTVLEQYPSSEALLGHMGVVMGDLMKLFGLADVDIHVYGMPSPELVNAAQGMPLTVHPHFLQGVAN